MYIKHLKVRNIRSITEFDMQFDNPAGWHVLIGDNGAGKSTIIRSMATALVGPVEIQGIKPNWENWLQWGTNKGEIILTTGIENNTSNQAPTQYMLEWHRFEGQVDLFVGIGMGKQTQKQSRPKGEELIFSTGFGPFRRFTGGDKESEEVFANPRFQKLASHLSLFDEKFALTETVKWLTTLRFEELESKGKHRMLKDIMTLVNSDDFMPHGAKLEEVNSKGAILKDGNGASISINQMSDGYRSILSLTFELIRQLVLVYDEDKVFRMVRKGKMHIDLPGVVLVDEIDAHLHPTWQTRIGQWFLKYFPNIQFIVTSHSPLVCRACEKGSIWRLSSPGSDIPSGEVTGSDKDKLIFGNVLDAYGTEVFGKAVTISKEGNEKRTRMGELNMRSLIGEKLNPKESEELHDLKRIFPTEKVQLK